MDEDNTPALTRRLEAHAHGGKSKLYQHLRSQHRALSRAMAKLNPTWASIAAEIASAGVMGNNGKPASPTSVRNAWWRVCRDVEADKQVRQAEKDRRGRHPSRLPATRRPAVAEPARAAEQLRAPAVPRAELRPQTGTSLLDADDLPEDVRENLAALERQFAWADRFVNPPKKED